VSLTWVDSHCHLQERYLPGEGAEDAAASLRRSFDSGVTGVVCVGTDEVTSRQAIALAADAASGRLGGGLPDVKASAGLHPHEATNDVRWLEGLLEDGRPELVGVGECGLDYYYEHAPKAEQRRAFAHQIALAHRHGLTLVIHAREAWDDLFEVLESEGVPSQTVLHCFTGGPTEASRCVEAGMAVSFSGIVTFKSADDVRAAVREVPLEHLLVETDSPFLAPVPHRGATNEPAWVPLVGVAVAEAGGWSSDEVASASRQNAARLFRLDLVEGRKRL